MSTPDIAARLEYLRGQIRGECISYGELAELQSLAAHIDPTLRCPTATTTPTGEPHTVIGCGSEDVAGPDDEGLFDCRACGIWFDPAREVTA